MKLSNWILWNSYKAKHDIIKTPNSFGLWKKYHTRSKEVLAMGVSDKEFASILSNAEEEHLTDEQIDAILETSIEPGQDDNSKLQQENNDEDMEESDKDKSSMN